KTIKYSDLYGGKLFSFDLATLNPAVTTQTGYIPGQGNTKPVGQYKLVGKLQRRIDIPAKIAGTYTYIHNVRVPGMVHARRVRPRGTGANSAQNHFPLSVDQSSIKHIPGAQVVQIGNFLAVVAPKEYDAIQAAAQLKVVWKDDPKFGSGTSGNYWSWLRKSGDTNTDNPARWTADTGSVPTAMAGAAKTVSATYKYQYNNFVPIGPHAAIADVKGTTSAVLYVQGQSINGIPPNIAGVLGFPNPTTTGAANVRVIWYEGSSSYGGGFQGEAAEQAALISQQVGKPVRLQWMRWDQHGWDHYGPAQMYDVKLGADANGKIVAADWTSCGQAQSNLDRTKESLGTATWPSLPANGGPTPSLDAVYANAAYGPAFQYQRRTLAKTQPLYSGSLCCNFLRAPNAPQSYFASEQIVDELAHALNMDPIAFRRKNIDGTTTAGARWLSVLDASTLAAGWKPKVAASNLQKGDEIGRAS